MCGRFVANTPTDELARFLGAPAPSAEDGLEPSHNVAPTQLIHAVHEPPVPPVPPQAADSAEDAVLGVRSLDTFRWGLVPSWAKDPRIGARMINARAETVDTKNSFRSSFKKRRCIIAADGFYEWRRISGSAKKQPMFISNQNDVPFAFAGLWSSWRDPNRTNVDGTLYELRTATILTCAANATMAAIHDRMPVILASETWDYWLDPQVADAAALKELLVPAPADLLRMHPVSTKVNNARNNGPDLIKPIGVEHIGVE
ncbi:MAG: SOS response-associated peptidase [Acidimicrobiaceae bacterium]|nr:SOS response-associated peptidase [Acidimicrobiaceae bacterium]